MRNSTNAWSMAGADSASLRWRRSTGSPDNLLVRRNLRDRTVGSRTPQLRSRNRWGLAPGSGRSVALSALSSSECRFARTCTAGRHTPSHLVGRPRHLPSPRRRCPLPLRSPRHPRRCARPRPWEPLRRKCRECPRCPECHPLAHRQHACPPGWSCRRPSALRPRCLRCLRCPRRCRSRRRSGRCLRCDSCRRSCRSVARPTPTQPRAVPRF